MSILAALFGSVRAILRRRAALTLENLALRQQLAVLRPSVQARTEFSGRTPMEVWVGTRTLPSSLVHLRT